jgi:hypothetical protein
MPIIKITIDNSIKEKAEFFFIKIFNQRLSNLKIKKS